MANKQHVLICAWLPEGMRQRWAGELPEATLSDDPGTLKDAAAVYGLPPVDRLGEARNLRWIQLISAGVPQELCPAARERGIKVTNLTGLYGVSIAEHAFCLMALLAHKIHLALDRQRERRWDRTVAQGVSALQGKTLAVVGLGNIGQSIARLGQAYGMRVVGCRRTDRPAPHVDKQYPLSDLKAMLAEADYVAVAAPLTRHTEGLLGPDEFAAMKPGARYINVSRGPVAQEKALLDALQSGRLAGAGLDVFTTEPLPESHPLWTLPNVVLTPHYCGEVINTSARPAERFLRNFRNWQAGRDLEGTVDLVWGY